MRYNFCIWWNEKLGFNPFEEVKEIAIEAFNYQWLIDDWKNKSVYDLDFFQEPAVIRFADAAEEIAKNKGLTVVWSNHGTKPNLNEVVFCVQQIEVKLWERKKSNEELLA